MDDRAEYVIGRSGKEHYFLQVNGIFVFNGKTLVECLEKIWEDACQKNINPHRHLDAARAAMGNDEVME